MKSKTKKIAAIIVAIIVVLVIAGALLLIFAPWKYKDTEDSVITNIKALQKLDGYLYVYGEEISEISILEDYKDAPYQKIESITSALKSSTHAQNCLVISDVDGTVSLSEDDYTYIYTLVYKYDWWLMYIGTDETHITQLLKHKLAHEDAENNVGYILKNSQFGNYTNIWTEEDTAIYKSANKRLFVESMLHTFLYAIKNL